MERAKLLDPNFLPALVDRVEDAHNLRAKTSRSLSTIDMGSSTLTSTSIRRTVEHSFYVGRMNTDTTTFDCPSV
jgi:hypothetical protein